MRYTRPGLLNLWIRPGRGGIILVVAVIAGFLLHTPIDHASGGDASYWLGLSREGMFRGAVWQPLTFWLVHGSPMHLLFNAFLLFILSRPVEHEVGTRRFWILAGASQLAGAAIWLLWSHRLCIGASGIVFALIGAFVALGPHRPVLLFFVLEMPAYVLGVGLLVIQLVVMVANPGSDTAHIVHLAGGFTGFLMFWPPVRAWFGERTRDVRIRKRRLRVIEGGAAGGTGASGADVDALLDKIAREGMASLTARERAQLEAASRERNKR